MLLVKTPAGWRIKGRYNYTGEPGKKTVFPTFDGRSIAPRRLSLRRGELYRDVLVKMPDGWRFKSRVSTRAPAFLRRYLCPQSADPSGITDLRY